LTVIRQADVHRVGREGLVQPYSAPNISHWLDGALVLPHTDDVAPA
jgi:hypothetical protein